MANKQIHELPSGNAHLGIFPNTRIPVEMEIDGVWKTVYLNPYDIITLTIAESLVDQFYAKADLVDGKVPPNQLPSYVDAVDVFEDLASFPAVGDVNKIYVETQEGRVYRWASTGPTTGSYFEISPYPPFASNAQALTGNDTDKIISPGSMKYAFDERVKSWGFTNDGGITFLKGFDPSTGNPVFATPKGLASVDFTLATTSSYFNGWWELDVSFDPDGFAFVLPHTMRMRAILATFATCNKTGDGGMDEGWNASVSMLHYNTSASLWVSDISSYNLPFYDGAKNIVFSSPDSVVIPGGTAIRFIINADPNGYNGMTPVVQGLKLRLIGNYENDVNT